MKAERRGALHRPRGVDLGGAQAYAKRLTRAALDRPVAAGLADERRSFLELLKQPSAREGLAKGRRPAEIQKV